jgi:hypothetical protein
MLFLDISGRLPELLSHLVKAIKTFDGDLLAK